MLALIQFAEQYANEVAKFGVLDAKIMNGAASLSMVFIKKLLKNSSKIILEIIKRVSSTILYQY